MQKVFLKPWTDAVADELFLALRDEDVYRFIPTYAPESALEFCKRHRPDPVGPALVYSAHIEVPGEPAIGLTSVTHDSQGRCDLGFMVSPRYWGNGFGSVIIDLTLSEISNQLGQQVVTAKADSNNVASIHSLIAAGFIEIERVETMLKWEATVDVILRRNV